MKRTSVIMYALLLVLFARSAPAQEWSAEQKEVWKNVEAYWALDAAGNLEGFMAYVHPDYQGWNYRNTLPRDKASVRKWAEYYYQASKTIIHEIKPLGIKIHGNIAIVHYYYSSIIKDAEGKNKSDNGRWTDILLKQGDKWLIIGDHGGEMAK